MPVYLLMHPALNVGVTGQMGVLVKGDEGQQRIPHSSNLIPTHNIGSTTAIKLDQFSGSALMVLWNAVRKHKQGCGKA